MPDLSSQQPNDNSPHILTVGALIMDTHAWHVHLNGEPINLTLLQFKVLVYLAQNAGRVVTRDELLVWVWKSSPDAKGTANVDSCVQRLRRKLGEWGKAHLSTVRGVGYRLDAENAESQWLENWPEIDR